MQAAQVIEARLSRYGTITTDLPAAPASVVACCAAHCQLLEACQAGASHFRLLDYTLPVRVLVHGRARLPQIPEAESITNTNYNRVVTTPRLHSERQ